MKQNLEKNIRTVVLKNGLVFVAKVTFLSVDSDPSQYDVRLDKPLIVEGEDLKKWLENVAITNTINMFSDDILVILEPSDNILKQYIDKIAE